MEGTVSIPWWVLLLILLALWAALFFLIIKPIIDWLFFQVVSFVLRRMGHTQAEVDEILDGVR